MSNQLLIVSALVGILVVFVGISRAYSQGEFMPMILGMLILMSCAGIYIKRHTQGEEDQDESSDESEDD